MTGDIPKAPLVCAATGVKFHQKLISGATGTSLQDEGELSPETEQEWAQALLKIKRKDPSIYDASTKLFLDSATSGDDSASPRETEDGEGGPVERTREKKSKKKRLLREILYEQVCSLLSITSTSHTQILNRCMSIGVGPTLVLLFRFVNMCTCGLCGCACSSISVLVFVLCETLQCTSTQYSTSWQVQLVSLLQKEQVM